MVTGQCVGGGTGREETAKSAPGDQLVAEEEPVSKHVPFCVLAKEFE